MEIDTKYEKIMENERDNDLTTSKTSAHDIEKVKGTVVGKTNEPENILESQQKLFKDEHEEPSNRVAGVFCCGIALLLILVGVIMSVFDSLPFTSFSIERLGTLLWIVGIFAVCFASLCFMEIKESNKGKYEFKRMNSKYQKYQKSLNDSLQKFGKRLPAEALKMINEEKQKLEKAAKKEKDIENSRIVEKVRVHLKNGESLENVLGLLRPKVYVFEFIGDTMVRGMDVLRKEVSIILSVATQYDEVVCILTSYGGVVHSYGLAASQLARIRKAGVKLTVCVDSVAASGGYMMACVANKLIASPCAFVGSIGVVSYRPNFQKILKKSNVDLYLLTSGRYKRTIDVVGDVTEEGIAKAQEELTSIHESFKSHVKLYRPQLDIDKVATGEAWLASETFEKDLNLVDELLTSDEYIEQKCKTHDVIRLKRKKEKGWAAVMSKASSSYYSFSSWISELTSSHPSAFAMDVEKAHYL